MDLGFKIKESPNGKGESPSFLASESPSFFFIGG